MTDEQPVNQPVDDDDGPDDVDEGVIETAVDEPEPDDLKEPLK